MKIVTEIKERMRLTEKFKKYMDCGKYQSAYEMYEKDPEIIKDLEIGYVRNCIRHFGRELNEEARARFKKSILDLLNVPIF